MSFTLAPVTLRGAHASLVPLSADHGPALSEAVRDGELWRLWYTVVPHPDGMSREIDRRLAPSVPRYCAATDIGDIFRVAEARLDVTVPGISSQNGDPQRSFLCG